jgi:uncharacterized protein
MKLMTRSIALASLALATTLCAAQGSSSPAKKELVQKILQYQKSAFEGLGNTIAGQLSNQVMQMTGQAVMRAPADKREALANEVKADVKKFHDEASAVLREQAGRVGPGIVGAALEEKYTEEELKTLLAWLESPVSRKFQQTAVDVQQSLSQKVVADTKPAIEPKLKALEQTLSKKLTDAGVPTRPRSAASAPPAKK